MKAEKLIQVLNNISAKIETEAEFLTELDNVIGDGDHGINMSRGFKEVDKKLAGMTGKMPSDVLSAVGMTLVGTVGGSAGPLYGTAFMKAGGCLKGKEDVSIGDFLEALQAAIDGVMARGKSTKGEKTMLDAMIPAKEAMDAALKDGKEAKDVLAEGVKAAWEGVEYTKTIAATKGRASYLGERSIGHQDPGATSFSMILETLEKEV